MTYQRRFYIAATIATASGLAVADASMKIKGSMGMPAIVSPALWQLAISVAVFSVSAPVAVYFNARRKVKPSKESYEIEALLQKSKHQPPYK